MYFNVHLDKQSAVDSGLVYTEFMKNCFCDVMWNINGSFLCHFHCFHDHNSDYYSYPVSHLELENQKIVSQNIPYCEMPR